MYGFLLKKSFCDAWDNLLLVVVANILLLFSFLGISLLFTVVSAAGADPGTLAEAAKTVENAEGFVALMAEIGSTNNIVIKLLQCVVLLLGTFLFSVIALAMGEVSFEIANFNGVSILDFFRAVPGVLLDAFKFALLITLAFIISVFSINYYFTNGTMMGIFMGALLFWIDVILVLSLQWFVPIRSTFHNKFGKCIKKCFLIFFDNTGYSIFVFIWEALLAVLSFLLVGFIPSVGGIVINQQNTFRTRMYKYDYLEEHPELQTKRERRKIPWEELIYDDRETLGPRKLKSFIFPWRD